MVETFRACSISSKSHAETTIDGITVRFSERAASDDGDCYTKGGDVDDPPIDPEVVQF